MTQSEGNTIIGITTLRFEIKVALFKTKTAPLKIDFKCSGCKFLSEAACPRALKTKLNGTVSISNSLDFKKRGNYQKWSCSASFIGLRVQTPRTANLIHVTYF